MDDKFNDKLVLILSLFKDRPNHLAKFLIDNSAFNKTFMNKVSKCNTEIENDDYIDNINSLNDVFNSILDPDSKPVNLDERLIELLMAERYEEAARIRDQINKKNKKKK